MQKWRRKKDRKKARGGVRRTREAEGGKDEMCAWAQSCEFRNTGCISVNWQDRDLALGEANIGASLWKAGLRIVSGESKRRLSISGAWAAAWHLDLLET